MNNVTYRKGDYVLQQCDGDPNWHYWIMRDDGVHLLLERFCACDKRLTMVEASDAIDVYVKNKHDYYVKMLNGD